MFEVLNPYDYENHNGRIRELIREAENERIYAELKRGRTGKKSHRNFIRISFCSFGCLLERLGRAMRELSSAN